MTLKEKKEWPIEHYEYDYAKLNNKNRLPGRDSDRMLTRICASLRFRMKFKTLFMSDKEKLSNHLICVICHSLLICRLSSVEAILGPLGLSSECVQISVM